MAMLGVDILDVSELVLWQELSTMTFVTLLSSPSSLSLLSARCLGSIPPPRIG